jgi:hypothetical protein
MPSPSTALAGGANPDSSKELALRARQLAEPKMREQLAESIGHLLELVDRGSVAQLGTNRVPFSRARVQAIRPRLIELAERLRGAGDMPSPDWRRPVSWSKTVVDPSISTRPRTASSEP